MTTQKKNSRLSARAILCQVLGMLMALTVALPSAAGDAKSVHAEVKNSVVAVVDGGEVVGSGVIVGEDIVVTNHHVVEEIDEDGIQIRQAANEYATQWHDPIKAEKDWCEEKQDLCLLYVPGVLDTPDARIATMGEANALSIGDDVYAFGNPDGFELSLTRGIVSKLNYDLNKPLFVGFDFGRINAPMIQTDADVLGGSSGGGLFNEDGELIGITTLTNEDRGSTLTYAVPVELVAELLAEGSLEAKEEHAVAFADALRHHAQKGNVQAQFDLGWLYDEMNQNADIHHKKLTDGERWFLGLVDAESLEWLFQNFADMKAVGWYERAAEQGHVNAQYNLAFSYDAGIGAEDGDKIKAANWYYEVVNQQDLDLSPFAANRLGELWEAGEGGLERDEEEAAVLYDIAVQGFRELADVWDAEGQYYLGKMYKAGRGVEQNTQEAYFWFFVAAENGDENAVAARDKLREEGDGFDAHATQTKAETYIAKRHIEFAEEGILTAEGQYYLAGLYKEGKGVEQDIHKAYFWFFVAAGSGHEDANAEVLKMHKEYEADDIRDAQTEAALYLAEQSATDGEAYIWLFFAAKNGNEDAAAAVEEMREDFDDDVVRELEDAAEAAIKELNSEE